MIQIRHLTPADILLIERHYLRLSREDRRLRFGRPMSDDLLKQYCTEMPWLHAAIIGHIRGGELRGMAIVAWGKGDVGPGGQGTCELGITVEGDWRRRGIGAALLHRGVTIARNRGMKRMFVNCLAENRPMQMLARKFSPQVTLVEGEMEHELELAAATPFTVMEESMMQSAGLWDRVADQFRSSATGERPDLLPDLLPQFEIAPPRAPRMEVDAR